MNLFKSLLIGSVALLAISCDKDEENTVPDPSLGKAQIQVIAKGTAVAQPQTVNDPIDDTPVEAFCFLMDLFDAETGEVVGTLRDCDLQSSELEDGSLISQVLTTFNFDGKGSVSSFGEVLQIPIGDGKFTTSLAPNENNIVDATFDFQGRDGKVSLIGEIDLAQFDQNIITFNCNFTIALDEHY